MSHSSEDSSKVPIEVEGESELEANFGADVFRWKEGNDRSWNVEGHVGHFASSSVAEMLSGGALRHGMRWPGRPVAGLTRIQCEHSA